jgi:hypothetical protein
MARSNWQSIVRLAGLRGNRGLSAIESVTVAMQSQGGATETQDHWVISELRVTRTLGIAAPQCILDQPGTVITTNATDVFQPGGC